MNGGLKDLPDLKLHHHIERHHVLPPTHDLKSLQCDDAPLTQHPDAQALYNLLCTRIADLEEVVANPCSNWEGAAKDQLLGMVREEMPEADGGISSEKWWVYVWCVVKALCVWQAYVRKTRDLFFTWIEQAEARAGREFRRPPDW
jgi:hypothetical protein